ncbi:hypothetical protein [Pseudomonas sp. LRF_L74]|uniref:hypothetical protein n=1 Tax=Pseudomonas sp. LRF_L74 TaxID=3369422 RepID=UPI003F5EBE57
MLCKSSVFLSALFMSGIAQADTNQCAKVDDVVINAASNILNIEKDNLKIAVPFSQQVPPGDDLDVIEIIMMAENELDVEVPNQVLEQEVKSSSHEGLAARVTIEKLQGIVKAACEGAK